MYGDLSYLGKYKTPPKTQKAKNNKSHRRALTHLMSEHNRGIQLRQIRGIK